MAPRRTPDRLTRRAALQTLLATAAGPALAADTPVDLALVLAIDCSASVDPHEYALQMQGLARAFASAEVQQAIAAGKLHRIAITAFHWSETDNQRMVLPWTTLAAKRDADAVAALLAAAPRTLDPGGTAIGAAMLFAYGLLKTAPDAPRRVIDISSDGRNNVGPPSTRVRDALVAKGLTINGLVIRNEWPTLDVYFDKQVVGGEGHFVISADDYQAYGEAIQRKLVKEITGPGVA